MKPVRWALWGCGSMARAFVADMQTASGNVVHSVASRTPDRARALASVSNSVRWHSSLDSLLDDPNVDVVYVSTPPDSHFKDCLTVLSAGKGLLCEKPLALNGREAQIIADTARNHGVFCMEAMWMLLIPAVREAQRMIQAGAIGVPHFLSANFSHLEGGDRLNHLANPARGGGALLDRGVYPLHLATALFGSSAVAGASLQKSGASELQISCILQHDSGVQSNLVASFLATGTNIAEVSGDAGVLRLHAPFYRAHRLSISPRRATPFTTLDSTAGVSLNRNPAIRRFGQYVKPYLDFLQTRSFVWRFPGGGYQFEILEVADCIRSGRCESRIVPLQRTLAVMNLVDEVRAISGSVQCHE